MNEKMKKLQEMVKNDPKLFEKMKACKTIDDAKKFVKELGINIVDANFEQTKKLNEKELESVAGGGCGCFIGGGGGGNITCFCVEGGAGTKDGEDDNLECVCPMVGAGWED